MRRGGGEVQNSRRTPPSVGGSHTQAKEYGCPLEAGNAVHLTARKWGSRSCIRKELNSVNNLWQRVIAATENYERFKTLGPSDWLSDQPSVHLRHSEEKDRHFRSHSPPGKTTIRQELGWGGLEIWVNPAGG